MAISGQDKSSYQTEQLSFNLVVFLLEQIRAASIQSQRHKRQLQQQQQEQIQPQRRLKLGIDANLLGYKYVHNRSSFQPDGAVAHIAKALSERLIDVVIVCDGNNRHHSKRVSCKRRAEAEKQNIRLIIARAELQSLLSTQDDTSPIERANLIAAMQKKIRGLENALKRQLPTDFDQKLKAFVDGYKSEEKGNITMEIAPTQADPCLAKMAVDGEIDAIISGDSDFAVYVGPGGCNGMADIMLKDVKLSMIKEPVQSCKLYTGQKAVADQIEAILQPKIDRSPFDNGRVPQYPLFSGQKDPMVRALIALLVGCDACPGGVDGMGPKVAHELLTKNSSLSGTVLHDKLAEFISSSKNARIKEKTAVMAAAKSILYERTNHGYIYDAPAQFERYIREFADEGTKIVDGPAIITCNGYCTKPHLFLEAEGTFPCEICRQITCRFCHMREDEEDGMDGSRLICLSCARSSISGTTQEEDEAEMRAYLCKKGQTVPAAATYIEVLSLFKKAEAGEFDFFQDDIQKVKYPLLPASALHRSQTEFERVAEVKVCDIPDLIGDSVSGNMVCLC